MFGTGLMIVGLGGNASTSTILTSEVMAFSVDIDDVFGFTATIDEIEDIETSIEATEISIDIDEVSEFDVDIDELEDINTTIIIEEDII